MILDDTDLADLLRDAGDCIDVPADGPRRVLEARDELGGGRSAAPRATHERWWANHGWLGAAALVALVVAGITVLSVSGGSTGSKGSAAMSGAAGTPSLSAGPSAGPSASSSAASSSGTGPAGGPAGGAAGAAGASGVALTPPGAVPAPGPGLGPSSQVPPPAVPTRVIKTGAVSVVVAKARLSSTVTDLTTVASGLGGYVTDSKSAEGGGAPSADVTVRVPVAQFETLLARVRAIGQPTSITTSGQDVTAQYVDLDARIHSLQATRDQFLLVLSKATAIGDILNVEQQLSGLQTQIEQLQGQQRVLSDQTSFGTLAVHLSEATPADPVAVGPLKAPNGWTTAWHHARHSFAHGAQSVIAASGGLALFAFVVAAVALLSRLAWGVVRRRLV